jgi:hypothetical protein
MNDTTKTFSNILEFIKKEDFTSYEYYMSNFSIYYGMYQASGLLTHFERAMESLQLAENELKKSA